MCIGLLSNIPCNIQTEQWLQFQEKTMRRSRSCQQKQKGQLKKQSLFLVMFFNWLLLVGGSQGRHRGTAAVGTVVLRGRFIRAGLSFLLLLLELVGEDGEFFDGVIIGIVPPLVLPVGGSSESLFAKANVIFSPLDLNAVLAAVLVFAEAVAFFPAHLYHQVFGVLAFEADVGDS